MSCEEIGENRKSITTAKRQRRKGKKTATDFIIDACLKVEEKAKKARYGENFFQFLFLLQKSAGHSKK